MQIAQSLAALATTLGIATTVIDPRARFLTEERFPGVTLDDRWPDEAIAALKPGPATAVVTLSHDIKIDDPALIAALATDAPYVGALGSRRSHAARRERLAAEGLSAVQIDRIDAPVGIDIGAIGPSEIALSIAAAMVGRSMIAAEDCVLVLLAAGRSQRMGDLGSKLDEPFLGRALGLHVAVALEDMPFRERVAVVGKAQCNYAAHGYTTVRNDDPALGLGRSVALGVDCARAHGAQAVVVALADMPRVTATHIWHLLEAADGPDAVVASSDGISPKPRHLRPQPLRRPAGAGRRPGRPRHGPRRQARRHDPRRTDRRRYA